MLWGLSSGPASLWCSLAACSAPRFFSSPYTPPMVALIWRGEAGKNEKIDYNQFLTVCLPVFLSVTVLTLLSSSFVSHLIVQSSSLALRGYSLTAKGFSFFSLLIFLFCYTAFFSIPHWLYTLLWTQLNYSGITLWFLKPCILCQIVVLITWRIALPLRFSETDTMSLSSGQLLHNRFLFSFSSGP